MTDHCPACPFRGCPDCRYQGDAHFQAVMARQRHERVVLLAARRCIDRNVRDLPDRIEVAQALGLLPYVAHSRRADRTSGPRVERRPS